MKRLSLITCNGYPGNLINPGGLLKRPQPRCNIALHHPKLLPRQHLLLQQLLLLQLPPAPSTSAAPASPSSTVKAAYNLKFAYHTPPKAGLVPQYYVPWAKDIETASGGKVAITHYAGGSLVPMESAYQAVLSGLADMALVETDSIPGAFPLSEINALPFAFPNAEVEARVFHELVLKYCVNTELKDVKVLAVVAISPAQYYGNVEVKKLEDLKGLKIRTSGKGEADIVSALGASPVEISTGDIYSGLQKKTIDGVFFNTAGIPGFALQEVSKYRTICDLQPRAWLFVMNKKLYDGMPADVKAAFDKNSTPDVSAKYSAGL